MEEREEKIDPKDFMAKLKEVYQNFNEVLKTGDAGEKLGAIVRMEMLQKAVQDLAAATKAKSKFPPEMLLEAMEKNKEDIPLLNEIKRDMSEVEKAIEETKKLIETTAPIGLKKKRARGRLRLRRFGERKAK